MKTLLYYNPNVVTHETNFHLSGMERFSSFFRIFNPTVVFLDRTGTVKIPVNVKSLFPMPVLRPQPKSFEDICNEQARTLLERAEKLNVRIYCLYSGGIDSTLVLVSFLKNATSEQRKRLTVLLSEDSILENPNFYRDHIRGKLPVEPSGSFPYLLGRADLVVGAEHNDQLFGSDVVGRLIVRFGAEAIHAPYSRETFFTLFNESLDDPATTHFYLDLFERLKEAAPVPLRSNFDLLWWINFSVKWQSVFMRILSYTTPRQTKFVDDAYIHTNYVHFYGTEDFQLWSMNNQDRKIKDEWRTYKWVCKDIIYDYTKDAEYRDNKTKRGSLFHLLLQRKPYNFIDDSFTFHAALDPKEYYQEKNDFI